MITDYTQAVRARVVVSGVARDAGGVVSGVCPVGGSRDESDFMAAGCAAEGRGKGGRGVWGRGEAKGGGEFEGK